MSGWREIRLDTLAQPINDSVDPRLLGDERVAHFSIPALDATGEPAIEPASSIESNKQPLRGGEVLVSKLNPRKARVVLVPEPSGLRMIGSGEFIVLRPTCATDGRFLEYLMLAESTRQLLDASVQSVTRSHQRVRPDVLTKLKLRVPTKPEQQAIADYLDAETTRIDALITKKRRMIEVLNERQVALIQQTVALGLDPTASLRATKVELLDQIPSHWSIAPLAMLCSFQPGKAHEPFVDPEGQYICVNSRFISTSGRTVKRCTENLTPTQRSDILIVMSDLPNGRALGKAFFVDDDRPYAVNQRVCRISSHAIDPRYAFYQLDRSPRFLMHDDGSNQTHLANSVFTKFSMLLPPQSEQREIADFLDEKTGALAAASVSLGQQIELLQERRQSLITGAVTGQLEIPGVAA